MKSSKGTIKGKMAIIDESLKFLDERRKSFNPKKAAYMELQAIKHSLFEMAEACIDIANHIVASEGFQRPSSYGELFSTLAKEKLINDKLAERLKEMAQFRNIIVHKYEEIDATRLKSILDKDLADVREFARAIYMYMEK